MNSSIFSRRSVLLVYFGLSAGIFATFWQLRHHEFLTYDDDLFIVRNVHITGGLTWENVQWAWSTRPDYYWRPLTWLSLMLDWHFFGANAGAHHLTSVALHLATTLVLFRVFQLMTASVWRSAIVAALFAWHPLHVEPVAWASDRVDVLSGLFFVLSLWAYASYAGRNCARSKVKSLGENGGTNIHNSTFNLQGTKYYWMSLFFFLLALMAKPTVMTLPCVLLLLDFWPLKRMERFELKIVRRLLLEKLPFFFLSAGAASLAVLQQNKGGLIVSMQQLPLSLRLANAVISCGRYLRKAIWPNDLTVFYPHPVSWPVLLVVGTLLLLIVVSFFAMIRARRFPYLFVGWFWFLVTLLPVSGIVQVGIQSMADRYAYIPLIGLSIVFAWGGNSLAETFHEMRMAVVIASVVVLVLGAFLWCAGSQASYWQNTETLFRHALLVTPSSPVAHRNLASALLKNGKSEEAIVHYTACLQLDPSDFVGQINLGLLLRRKGKTEEALVHYRAALSIKEDSSLALNNLAWLLATISDARFRNGAEALKLAHRAVTITKHKDAEALDTLAAAQAETGEFAAAIQTAEQAVQLADASNEKQMAHDIRARLKLYQSGKAFHE